MPIMGEQLVYGQRLTRRRATANRGTRPSSRTIVDLLGGVTRVPDAVDAAGHRASASPAGPPSPARARRRTSPGRDPGHRRPRDVLFHIDAVVEREVVDRHGGSAKGAVGSPLGSQEEIPMVSVNPVNSLSHACGFHPIPLKPMDGCPAWNGSP